MRTNIPRHLIPLVLLTATQPAWASWSDGIVFGSSASQISQQLWIHDSTGAQIQRVFFVEDSSGVVRQAARFAPAGASWGAWSTSSITTSGGAGEVTSAMDKNGLAFVSYRAANRAHYIAWKPLCFIGTCPGWTHVRIDGNNTGNTADYGRYTSIAFVYNSDDTIKSIHVAAVMDPDTGLRRLRYSRCVTWPTCSSSSDWIKEEVPDVAPQPYRTAITGRVASDGRTHVDFYWAGTSDTWRRTWTSIAGGVWGNMTSIASNRGNLRLTRDGALVAMTIATGVNVYYGTANSYGASNWSFSLVSATDQGGVFADHMIDELGIPVVAFYRSTNDDVLVGRLVNGQWVRESVANSGDVGRYVSISQDLAGDYLLVYQDRTLNRVTVSSGY